MQYDLLKPTTKKRDFDPGQRVAQTMGRREMQILEDMAFQTTCHQAPKRVHVRISVWGRGKKFISSLKHSNTNAKADSTVCK